MARVYLAGPEVFLPDRGFAIAQLKIEICARFGLEGHYPLDGELDLEGLPPMKAGLAISSANEAMMETCDAAIANLTPFRGPSADVGTVYEVGFLRAAGKLVVGYSNDARPYFQRVAAASPQFSGARHYQRDGRWFDGSHMEIEDFDLTDNLMIDGGIVGSGGGIIVHQAEEAELWTDLRAFEQAATALAQILSQQGKLDIIAG